MEAESGYGGFKMEGKNSGATMYIHADDDLQDGVCINIYVNNNVQGVNNSILAESNVKMKNPGVAIYLDGLKFVERWNQKGKRKKVGPTASKRKCRKQREDVVKKKSSGSGSKSKLGLPGFSGMFPLLGVFVLVFVFLYSTIWNWRATTVAHL